MSQVRSECSFAEYKLVDFLQGQEQWLPAACDYHGSALPIVEMLRRGKMDLSYTLVSWEVYYKQNPSVGLQAILCLLRDWLK